MGHTNHVLGLALFLECLLLLKVELLDDIPHMHRVRLQDELLDDIRCLVTFRKPSCLMARSLASSS